MSLVTAAGARYSRRGRAALAAVSGALAAGAGALDAAHTQPLLLVGLFCTYAGLAFVALDHPAVFGTSGDTAAAGLTAIATFSALGIAFATTGFGYAPALLGLGLAYLGFAVGASR
ncbi:hypothetical protein [Salarchaeum japonicum]|uniref:Uncharacterized protein n=1 Tax=Salarchaeum japonicum TaxID=555573 RepID=A0AAV3SYR0_9EURY|nr:hypothetical protein [Salarchaeum japonicum]